MLLGDDVEACALHRLEFEFGMMGSAAAGRVKLSSNRQVVWASCILLVGAVLLAALPGCGGAATLTSTEVFYTAVNSMYPIPVKLVQDPSTAIEVEVELGSESPNTSYIIPVANYSAIANIRVENCMPPATVIAIFEKSYYLPCSLACKKQSEVLKATLREFAGKEQYAQVLSQFEFPVPWCLLGSEFMFRSTPATAASILENLNFVHEQNSLSCPATAGLSTRMGDMGCDKLKLGAVFTPDGSLSSIPPKEAAPPLFISAFITPITPNRPPTISGVAGVDEVELSREFSILPLTIEDIDAEHVKITLSSDSGLVRVSSVRSEIPVSVTDYVIPEYVPVFTAGAFNVSSPTVEFTASMVQARRAVSSIHLTPNALGTMSFLAVVNDMGQSGFPAQAESLNATLNFSFIVKPSIVPPPADFVNSDETFRIDWKPRMRYTKGGTLVTIPDDYFPCGGDVQRGRYDFSKNSSGDGTQGWVGDVPPEIANSHYLRRDCDSYPNAFWKPGERSHYVTLDEGGKQRTFIQMKLNTSGCETSPLWKVELAIQNANYSRMDLPEATLKGFKMDWFECRSGAWYCRLRNPHLTLNNASGAISRLKFFYDQQHRHLSDGVEDYRMTFTGEYDDVKSALSNITVAFPWLDTAYTAPELIIPYPYKGWPRTGRTFYGSNILRMRISDVPGQFTYIERPNRMWLVKGLYMIQRLGSVDEAKDVCSQDESCYGFQWLTMEQLTAIADTTVQNVPSVGLGATSGLPYLDPGAPFIPAQGFSDIPPASWGLGGSTWDELGVIKKIDWSTTSSANMPNAFFFRKPFDELDISEYSLNAMSYTKRPNPTRCLGEMPFTERMLDIRVLKEPINQAPIVTAEKPVWRIQQSYEFFLSGIKLWDEDAARYLGKMMVTAVASRGAFTNPDTTGLEYIVGNGFQDPLEQTFLCEYFACRRALSELRYKSADVEGEDFVTVTVDDLGNSGELGAQKGSVTLNLSLASGPYNIPPTVIIPGLSERVAAIAERVDISGIFVEDLDMNKPRWDKVYPEGLMTVTMSTGFGYFDVTRLRKYGMRGSLFLGPADGGVDEDCPCLTANNTCPCNQFRLSKYFKVSGNQRDIKWVVQQVSVWLFDEGTTKFVVTVNDNCNTGFSDDSGVQQPCLLNSTSVVVRTISDISAPRFLYVDPTNGRDDTSGSILSSTSDTLTFDANALDVDNAYTGLVVTISTPGMDDADATIGIYDGPTRTASAVGNYVIQAGSTFRIKCGNDLSPCATLQEVIALAGDYGIIRARPGIYSGIGNSNIDMMDKTMDIGSTDGYNKTLIDCGRDSAMAVFSPTRRSRVRIEGFSVRNCVGKRGGAMALRTVEQRVIGRVDQDGAGDNQCFGLGCSASPVFVNCYFFDNAASNLGGGVYISKGRPVFEDCVFLGNLASSGGAVYVRGGEPTFIRCLFYENVAELDGGAFSINGGRTIISGCNFTLNVAGTNGGAVHLKKGEVHIDNSFIFANVAGRLDGAVHTAGGEIKYYNVKQDGDRAGVHDDTLLEDVQSKRQQTLYTQTGFAPAFKYEIAGLLDPE